jgi:hypothetical protein
MLHYSFFFIEASHVYKKMPNFSGNVLFDGMSTYPANSVTSTESLNHLAAKESNPIVASQSEVNY